MRILHVITDIRIANGIASVVLNYFKHMPEDIVFDIVYFKEFENTKRQEFEALGGRVFRLSPPNLKSFFNSDWDLFFKEHKNEYEVIHIHAPHLASLIIPKAKRYGFKKIAVHCHSTWFSLFKKNRLRNKILSLPARYMHIQRFACGTEAGELWFGKGNFTVLPNAIDCEKFRYDKDKREENRKSFCVDDKFVVAHIGRVEPPQKNHPFLLRVFAEICKTRPDSVLLMIGAEETAALKELAETLGILGKAIFMGQRKDITDILRTADVFVFPSFYEGLPLSVIEAQAAGLPIVMSDRVTDEAMCTDKIIALPLEMSAEEWAENILCAAEKGVDDTYGQMQKSGWEINKTAKELEDFYRKWCYNG